MPVIITSPKEELRYVVQDLGFNLVAPGLYAVLRQLIDELEAQKIPVPPLLQAAAQLPDDGIDKHNAIFWYRRVQGDRRAELRFAHTMNGLINLASYYYDLGKEAVFNWEHIYDQDGQLVPFDAAKIRYIPGDIIESIGRKVEEVAPHDFLLASSAWRNGSTPPPSAASPVPIAAAS